MEGQYLKPVNAFRFRVSLHSRRAMISISRHVSEPCHYERFTHAKAWASGRLGDSCSSAVLSNFSVV